MRKLALLLLLFATLLQNGMAQKKLTSETDAQKKERMAWWVNDRFGMFIHWGLYALPARHEWVKNHERITTENYQKYFDNFNPDLYNPREWAKTAKAAGMKYAVITTKHHEGFCLFDSKFTDYKATNTPIGRDLLKEWVDAFRAILPYDYCGSTNLLTRAAPLDECSNATTVNGAVSSAAKSLYQILIK